MLSPVQTGIARRAFASKLVKLILLDKSNGNYLVEVLDFSEEAILTTGKVEGPKLSISYWSYVESNDAKDERVCVEARGSPGPQFS